MKEITHIYKEKKHPYLLTVLLLTSTLIFSVLGCYWNNVYYNNQKKYTADAPPLSIAMNGFHDNLHIKTIKNPDFSTSEKITGFAFWDAKQYIETISPELFISDTQNSEHLPDKTYSFTTVTDDYFKDACFIGDSRTVGISEYGNINGATFLCKSSLSIYDYEKKKIVFEDKKTSISEVLSERKFSKIYLMLGINECGIGTPENFYEKYSEVVKDIRTMQPDALIFIQGNLLVTQQKSSDDSYITNENISARNKLISTLANQKDIFYIDINESPLCKDGSLIQSYTWDHVHIKAQYYEIWKEFLLNHAIKI